MTEDNSNVNSGENRRIRKTAAPIGARPAISPNSILGENDAPKGICAKNRKIRRAPIRAKFDNSSKSKSAKPSARIGAKSPESQDAPICAKFENSSEPAGNGIAKFEAPTGAKFERPISDAPNHGEGGTTPSPGTCESQNSRAKSGPICRILTNIPAQIPVLPEEIALLETYWGALLDILADNDNDPA